MKKFTQKQSPIPPARELQPESIPISDHLIYCSRCHTPRGRREDIPYREPGSIPAAHPMQMPAGTL